MCQRLHIKIYMAWLLWIEYNILTTSCITKASDFLEDLYSFKRIANLYIEPWTFTILIWFICSTMPLCITYFSCVINYKSIKSIKRMKRRHWYKELIWKAHSQESQHLSPHQLQYENGYFLSLDEFVLAPPQQSASAAFVRSHLNTSVPAPSSVLQFALTCHLMFYQQICPNPCNPSPTKANELDKKWI